jgi:hypothetical protein
MSEEQLYTEEQVRAYGEELVRQQAQEKGSVHSFFTKIIQNPSTIRIGNVSDEELGSPQLTIRILKELELFSKDIEKNDLWAEYFKKMADITTETSLSKEGFLIRMSQTTKKELADVTPKRKVNKGWFKKKGSKEESLE